MSNKPISTASEYAIHAIAHSLIGTKPESTYFQNGQIWHFPLQMALFFNVTYFPVWLTTMAVMLPIKLINLAEFNTIILGIVLISTVMIEVIRLYMGYLGNLTENIPGLAGFWMLSLLLQTPLQLLLLHPVLQPSLVERVSQTVMCCLLVCQLIAGGFVLHRLVRHSAMKFHISKFLSDKESDRCDMQ